MLTFGSKHYCELTPAHSAKTRQVEKYIYTKLYVPQIIGPGWSVYYNARSDPFNQARSADVETGPVCPPELYTFNARAGSGIAVWARGLCTGLGLDVNYAWQLTLTAYANVGKTLHGKHIPRKNDMPPLINDVKRARKSVLVFNYCEWCPQF